MIKLYAMIEEQGDAIVEVNPKEYYLVRPPYRKEDRTRVNEKDLGPAVYRDGFSMEHSGREFDDYEVLSNFLNQKVVEARRMAGLPITTQEEIKKMLGELKHGRK